MDQDCLPRLPSESDPRRARRASGEGQLSFSSVPSQVRHGNIRNTSSQTSRNSSVLGIMCVLHMAVIAVLVGTDGHLEFCLSWAVVYLESVDSVEMLLLGPMVQLGKSGIMKIFRGLYQTYWVGCLTTSTSLGRHQKLGDEQYPAVHRYHLEPSKYFQKTQ